MDIEASYNCTASSFHGQFARWDNSKNLRKTDGVEIFPDVDVLKGSYNPDTSFVYTGRKFDNQKQCSQSTMEIELVVTESLNHIF